MGKGPDGTNPIPGSAPGPVRRPAFGLGPPGHPTLPQILARRYGLADGELVVAIAAARMASGPQFRLPEFNVAEMAIGTRSLHVIGTGTSAHAVVRVRLAEIATVGLARDVRGWGHWLEVRGHDGSGFRLLLAGEAEATAFAEILDLAVTRANRTGAEMVPTEARENRGDMPRDGPGRP